MAHDHLEANLGISRRDLIRRGAVVGGTLVWAAPVVQSLRPAFAQAQTGSPACDASCTITLRFGSVTREIPGQFKNPDCVCCCLAGSNVAPGSCDKCTGDPCAPDNFVCMPA